MSELKSYIAPTADGTGLADYYLKSEADKVIADLEESHKMEVEQLLIEITELKDKALQYKVLYKEKCRDINTQERFFAEERAYDKYKRCLAMAMWCKTSARCDEGLGAFKYRDWYWKWFKRWMKLAEKFKGAK